MKLVHMEDLPLSTLLYQQEGETTQKPARDYHRQPLEELCTERLQTLIIGPYSD